MHWGSPRLEWAALSPPRASHQKFKLFLSYCAPFMALFYSGGNQGTDLDKGTGRLWFKPGL